MTLSCIDVHIYIMVAMRIAIQQQPQKIASNLNVLQEKKYIFSQVLDTFNNNIIARSGNIGRYISRIDYMYRKYWSALFAFVQREMAWHDIIFHSILKSNIFNTFMRTVACVFILLFISIIHIMLHYYIIITIAMSYLLLLKYYHCRPPNTWWS